MFWGPQSCFGYPTRSEHLIKVMDAFCLPLFSTALISHCSLWFLTPHSAADLEGPCFCEPAPISHLKNFPGEAGGRQAEKGPLEPAGPPCPFPKLAPNSMVMSVTDNGTNLLGNTPEHSSSVLLRLDFAENGRWHPTPSSVPRVWLVYAIPRQLAHTGTLWGHHKSCESCLGVGRGGICIIICAPTLWGRILHFVQDATGHRSQRL